jgi:hypothetical protein
MFVIGIPIVGIMVLGQQRPLTHPTLRDGRTDTVHNCPKKKTNTNANGNGIWQAHKNENKAFDAFF